MKQILLQGVFLLLTIAAFGQVSQNVLYLKNGGVLRGVVLESTDTTKVKIEILGGSIFVVNKADIERQAIEKAPSLKSKGVISSQADGFYQEMSLGLPLGYNQYNWFTSGITLNYLLGYQYKRNLKFGLGTGIDHYKVSSTMFPLFLRVTGDLTDKGVTPNYIADIGYAANISTGAEGTQHRGGLLLFLGAGLKFNTRRALYYKLSAGYKTQFSSSHYDQWWREEPFSEYRQFNRVECRLSIGF